MSNFRISRAWWVVLPLILGNFGLATRALNNIVLHINYNFMAKVK